MKVLLGRENLSTHYKSSLTVGKGTEGGRFSDFLQVTTAYLIMKLNDDGDVKNPNRNVRVFEPAWTEPVGPTTEATKAMLQAEYGMRSNKVKKLWIKLSTEYGLVLIQCTNYLQSRPEGQEKWERTSNERDLIKLLRIIEYLSQKYDKDTEYHHVAYHPILHRFMLSRQG